jgi:hypothetical protein
MLWQTGGNIGGATYISPDPFNSTVGNNVMESRTFRFLRRVGTTPEDFGHLLNDCHFLFVAIAGFRYRVDSLFTPWPLSEYSAVTQARLTTGPSYSGCEVPRSERLRLTNAFDEMQRDDGSSGELDVIVFAKDYVRPYVHPERGGERSGLVEPDIRSVAARRSRP